MGTVVPRAFASAALSFNPLTLEMVSGRVLKSFSPAAILRRISSRLPSQADWRVKADDLKGSPWGSAPRDPVIVGSGLGYSKLTVSPELLAFLAVHELEGIVSGSGKSEGVVVVGGVGIGGGILTKGGADVGAIDGELRDSTGIEFLVEQ